MSIRLYIDQHVSGPITEGLRRRGIKVVTAHEDGAAEFDVVALLERATQQGYVLFNQDRDLLAIAHQWLETDASSPGISVSGLADTDHSSEAGAHPATLLPCQSNLPLLCPNPCFPLE